MLGVVFISRVPCFLGQGWVFILPDSGQLLLEILAKFILRIRLATDNHIRVLHHVCTHELVNIDGSDLKQIIEHHFSEFSWSMQDMIAGCELVEDVNTTQKSIVCVYCFCFVLFFFFGCCSTYSLSTFTHLGTFTEAVAECMVDKTVTTRLSSHWTYTASPLWS